MIQKKYGSILCEELCDTDLKVWKILGGGEHLYPIALALAPRGTQVWFSDAAQTQPISVSLMGA